MIAIETSYQLHRFRSRLEAKWAVFMDHFNVNWEYEFEGYDLDGIRYLPDFWLPDQQCWIEIKGPLANKYELNKAALLSSQGHHWVDIVQGTPSKEVIIGFREGIMKTNIVWGICIDCGNLGFGSFSELWNDFPENQWYGHCYVCGGAVFPNDKIKDGYIDALSYRFEYVRKENRKFLEIELAILDALKGNDNLNQTDLRSIAIEKVNGASDTSARLVIQKLSSSKRIKCRHGAQNSKIYSLSGSEK